MDLVVAVDVGGTFTDVVSSDGTTTWKAKAPTNPSRFADGVIGGCELIAEQIGYTLGELLSRTVRFGLGTTAVTNVLATKTGRRVGLLTTAGFETAMPDARNKLVSDGAWLVRPWSPVDPAWIRGIDERVDRDGLARTPLDENQVRAAVAELTDIEGVDAFAVSFLWSFKNPAHEQAAVDVIRSIRPDAPVFSGAELHPLLREYERMTAAVLNAYTATALDGVEELRGELESLGLRVPLLLLTSGGGAIGVNDARLRPSALAASGPAAGAVAAAKIAMLAGTPNVLSFDVGGTSVDVAVVRNGEPERSQSIVIEDIVIAQPAIDVESIGSGGGSIAWVDPRGLLRVGPQSARATPGPVCYGRGGVEPTVTDAMVLLGYIDPAAFMGGRMTLDVEAAREACARLGRHLKMTAIEVAHGIREIALAEMGKALRARIASGGIDVREFGLVAFGGSGSLFAAPIAQDIGISPVFTPSVASVLSAYGAATADMRYERMKFIGQLLDLAGDTPWQTLDRLLDQMNAQLAEHGVPENDRAFVCEIDMRFYRQKADLAIVVDPANRDPEDLLAKFKEAYAAKFGESSMTAGTPVEVSAVRVVGIARTIHASLPHDAEVTEGLAAPSSKRSVWIRPDEQAQIPVYRVDALHTGEVVEGPALIDDVDTTLWVPSESTASMGSGRTLITSF